MTGGIGFFVFFGYWHIFTTCATTTVGDMRAMKIAEDLNNGTGVAIAKVVTALGALPVTGSVALVAALSLLAAPARRRGGSRSSAGMALTVWAVHWAKGAVDRPRPDRPARQRDRTSPIRPGTRPTRSSTSSSRSRSGGCSRPGGPLRCRRRRRRAHGADRR